MTGFNEDERFTVRGSEADVRGTAKRWSDYASTANEGSGTLFKEGTSVDWEGDDHAAFCDWVFHYQAVVREVNTWYTIAGKALTTFADTLSKQQTAMAPVRDAAEKKWGPLQAAISDSQSKAKTAGEPGATDQQKADAQSASATVTKLQGEFDALGLQADAIRKIVTEEATLQAGVIDRLPGPRKGIPTFDTDGFPQGPDITKRMIAQGTWPLDERPEVQPAPWPLPQQGPEEPDINTGAFGVLWSLIQAGMIDIENAYAADMAKFITKARYLAQEPWFPEFLEYAKRVGKLSMRMTVAGGVFGGLIAGWDSYEQDRKAGKSQTESLVWGGVSFVVVGGLTIVGTLGGAALGSLVGPVGTLGGGFAGGILGGEAGNLVMKGLKFLFR